VLTDYHMHLAQDGLPYDDDDFSLAHIGRYVERPRRPASRRSGSPTTSTGSDRPAAGSTTPVAERRGRRHRPLPRRRAGRA